jgi:L-threonylcarbamoyladenylate synthase
MSAGHAELLGFRTDAEVEAALPQCIEVLRNDGLIVHPTETVYGIGGALTGLAVDRVNVAKGRPAEKSLLVVIGSTTHLAQIGLGLSDAASVLATSFWPGPLTLVLEASTSGPASLIRGPTGGVGVRLTGYANLRRLLCAFGGPMTSTSANRSGMPPTPDPVRAANAVSVRDIPFLALNAGELAASPPSTVVDCTGSRLRVVREGAISAAALRAAAGHLAWEN